MSVVKVYHNGSEFDVENTASLTREMIQEVGGTLHHIIFEKLGYSLKDEADANSKGVLDSVIKMESVGGFETINKNVGIKGVFDETKVNSFGFANLLHRHLLNATFKHFLDIEPIDITDGSVIAPYNTI